MRSQTSARALAGIALLGVLVCGDVVHAQESLVRPQQSPSPSVPRQQKTAINIALPCVQPPPLLRLQDYDGPFKKTVGLFTRSVDLKAVHPPHYQPGVMLCSLDLRDKFVLFVRDTFDPGTFVVSGFAAGLSQAENQDPSFGQGAAGYGKRFGASFADQTSFKFFKDFAYPFIFSEDPRYYRMSEGGGGRRFLHAAGHVIIAHNDNGNRMFNFSEWLGTASVVTLSNAYHPGNEPGFAPAAIQMSYSLAEDIGFDMLREFWPEISRKLRLPFRAEPVPSHSGSNPVFN